MKRLLSLACAALGLSGFAADKKIAVFVQNKSGVPALDAQIGNIRERIVAAFAEVDGFQVVDSTLAAEAFLSSPNIAKAVGCDEKTVKYLGITLLPQAGVALGMCVSAQELGAVDGLLVRNIVLFSVLIYELVGPLLTKEALTAAGEITAKPKEILERRAKALAEAGPKEFLEEREAKKQKKQNH